MTDTTREVIEVGNFTVTFVRRTLGRDGQREFFKKTRIYTADYVSDRDEKVAELQAAEAALGDRRFATRGVFPDVDKLYDRLNRNIARAKRDAAREVLVALRLLPGDAKLHFSRYAGCSCPCSPGTIADVRIIRNGYPVDIWVDVKKS